jgi:hypothetical protein
MDEKGDFDITQPRLSGFDFEEFTPEKPVVDEQVIPPEEPEPAPSEPGELHKLDILSDSYVGRWQRLVSSTNWQKGRIILEWRGALITENTPVAEYSDEAWGRRVGTVTGQHTGRLRRVYQRFGSTQASFSGLSWSHFHAAIDWDDAEMWLEGALQSSWSVTRMREHRWETLGGRLTDRPREEDIILSELDEDFDPAGEELPGSPGTTITPVYDQALSGPLHEDPDFGEESPRTAYQEPANIAAHEVEHVPGEQESLVSPFRDVENLPGDLGEALEAFKLAILRQKAAGWEGVSCQSVLDSLEALKQLALAPSVEQPEGQPQR